jgi:hypothetical protein
MLSPTSFDIITEELNSLFNCSHLAGKITVFSIPTFVAFGEEYS